MTDAGARDAKRSRMATRPQWWIDRAAVRMRELELAVERLRAALPEFPGVRGALVFGSYARRDVGPESDLDVIVVRETTLTRFRRDDDIRRALRLGVGYDLITLTTEQFARLPNESPFYAQAVREGLWIDATRPA